MRVSICYIIIIPASADVVLLGVRLVIHELVIHKHLRLLLGADLVYKGKGVRRLDVLDSSKALQLMLAVVETLGTIAALTKEPCAEADTLETH